MGGSVAGVGESHATWPVGVRRLSKGHIRRTEDSMLSVLENPE
jgi:hypothetical protein